MTGKEGRGPGNAVAQWIVRRLLRRFPAALRAQIGAELMDSVLRRVEERRAQSGRAAALLQFAKECAALHRAARTARQTLAPGVRLVRGGQREQRVRTLTVWGERLWPALLRALRRRPGSGMAVGALIAAGVGLGGMAVSVAFGPLFRTVPFPESSRLYHVWTERPWLQESRGLLADVQARAFVNGDQGGDLLEGAAAFRMVSGRVLGGARPVHAEVGRVSAGFFDMLGVEVRLGRTFAPGEDRLGAPWVAVISHDFWVDALGGDPDVLGRRLTIGWPEMEVIGVLPPDFRFSVPGELGAYESPDVWIPWWHHLAQDRDTGGTLGLVARVDGGVSAEQFQDGLNPVSAEESRLHYGGRGFRYRAEPLRSVWLRGRHGTLLAVWTGGLALLVLTAAGAIMLLLARHVGRGNHFFLLRSLGASRGGIAVTAMIESGAWLLGGAVLGVVGGSAFLSSTAGRTLAGSVVGDTMPLDGTHDLLVLGLAAFAVLILGFVPVALDALRRSVSGPRRNPFRDPGGPGMGRRLLLTAQIVAACALLVTAGAVGVAVQEWARRDLGYDPTDRLAFDLYLMDDYPDLDGRAAFHQSLREGLLAVPGVVRVGGSSALPMAESLPRVLVSREARGDSIDTSRILLTDDFSTLAAGRLDSDGGEDWRLANAVAVQPGHVRAMGMTLLSGRDVSLGDGVSSAPVMLLDSATAVGLLGSSDLEGGERLWAYGGWREVIGVLRPPGARLMEAGSAPQLYLPYGQVNSGRVSVVVETSGGREGVGDEVAEVVASLDPNVPIGNVRYLDDVAQGVERRGRLVSAMLWVFGGMGGAVVALSLYGVLALDVRRRRDEMALRRAVGAAPAGLVSMVLRDGVRIAMPGLMLGLGGTAVLSERMAGLLDQALKPDAIVFVTAGIAVLSVVVLAAMLPAARAASTDAARELGRDG